MSNMDMWLSWGGCMHDSRSKSKWDGEELDSALYGEP
jgi:hypothetical protein